jgi:hypothetical protein
MKNRNSRSAQISRHYIIRGQRGKVAEISGLPGGILPDKETSILKKKRLLFRRYFEDNLIFEIRA